MRMTRLSPLKARVSELAAREPVLQQPTPQRRTSGLVGSFDSQAQLSPKDTLPLRERVARIGSEERSGAVSLAAAAGAVAAAAAASPPAGDHHMLLIGPA